MLYQSFVSQPAGGVNYLNLFEQAFSQVSIKRFDAAVAYATSGGVAALDQACRKINAKQWTDAKKRWLVGIDYCRTEPVAIRQLQSMSNSRVRIHAGAQVVGRRQCTPILPFHPKLYLLHGNAMIGAICGSGNLSRNGLTKGHEVGNVMLTDHPSNSAEKLIEKICGELATWFATAWAKASAVEPVLKKYREIYDASDNLQSPTPTDDDTGDTEKLSVTQQGRRGLKPADLRRLRVCRHLWIEAGNLTKNRGPSKPGNQLMLSAMSRVFFGFPAHDLPNDTLIGMVALTYSGHTRDDCSLVYSNNSMDKLTLLVPGSEGPHAYDQKNLLFEKRGDGRFVLTLGTASQKKQWLSASRAIGADQRMSSGRKWGVF